jgi:hypothetical protein
MLLLERHTSTLISRPYTGQLKCSWVTNPPVLFQDHTRSQLLFIYFLTTHGITAVRATRSSTNNTVLLAPIYDQTCLHCLLLLHFILCTSVLQLVCCHKALCAANFCKKLLILHAVRKKDSMLNYEIFIICYSLHLLHSSNNCIPPNNYFY